jgi:hypothetical protein
MTPLHFSHQATTVSSARFTAPTGGGYRSDPIPAEIRQRPAQRRVGREGPATIGARVWMMGRGSGLTSGTVVSIGPFVTGALRPNDRANALSGDNIVITNVSKPGDADARCSPTMARLSVWCGAETAVNPSSFQFDACSTSWASS